ncbi:MAG TPA: YciI family protein [Candidatus Binataceae bacterium]
MLIYSSEAEDKKFSDAQNQKIMQGYMKFTQDLRASGKNKGGNALERTPNATTVRVRNGETVATDGPFAETKEQLGGYYVIEAKDLDEAIAIAAKIPSAEHGCVEVRPVINYGM